MIVKIRDSKWTKALAAYMALSMILQLIQPNTVMALSGGPSQPETSSFTPIGTSDMVDVFSGDFNYNIPLMDVGGYPLNLAYSGNTSMDAEASWAGFGWNINPGVINRGVRGLPDDFNGETIDQEFNMKPNISFSAKADVSGIEIFGFNPRLGKLVDNMSLGFGVGMTYNNYTGMSFSKSISPAFGMTGSGSEANTATLGANFTSSEDGLDISPTLSFSKKMKKMKNVDKIKTSIGVSINSRQGLKSFNVNATASGKWRNGSDKGPIHNKGDGGGSGVGTHLSFINNTYVPSFDMPRTNFSLSIGVTPDISAFGVDGGLTITGSFSRQKLAQKEKSIPAYGYMYSEQGQRKKEALMDFNRENDQAFTHNATNMPLTNFTYDAFSISGQGVGGMFRPHRSDIGYVHDPYTKTISGGGSGGVELGVGNVADFGAEVTVNVVKGESGMWEKHNDAKNKFDFEKKKVNSDFEPVYFKQEGELTIDEEIDGTTGNSLFDNVGGFDAVQIPILETGGFKVETVEGKYVRHNASVDDPTAPNIPPHEEFTETKRVSRDKRNQAITYLNKVESAVFGIEKYVSNRGRDQHISELTVLRNDGARYVYGIPAYNTKQREVSFNISKKASEPQGDQQTGLISYTQNVDNSINNKRGRDHFYSSKETPAYAHSYLLTSVLSSDYVDLDDNGPSVNDYGSYTKFVYGEENGAYNSSDPAAAPKYTPDIPNYKWRVPIEANTANYSQGLKPDLADDRGSYIYGEKDLWYLNKIETKTHIAVFHKTYDDRKDGYEVNGENGGINTSGNSTPKLNKISLYSIGDWNENYPSTDPLDPYKDLTPIKEVHFDYEYILCKDIPNNSDNYVGGVYTPNSNPLLGGKLTLTRVYFTYGNSEKGALSDYVFDYGDNDHDGATDYYDYNANGSEDPGESTGNPDYNMKGYDFWGCYKKNQGDGTISTKLTNPEFAFVEQDKELQDMTTSAWQLTSIQLPSGGIIQIERETDDYSYVQDQKAMQMGKILAAGNTNDFSDANTNSKFNLTGPDHYLFFELDEETQAAINFLTTPAEKSSFIQQHYGFTGELYFRFLVDMTNGLVDQDDESHEYVEGYTSVSIFDFGYDEDDNTAYVNVGYAKVSKTIPAKVNPIQKAAWHFGRMNLPRLVYDLPDPSSNANSENPGIGAIINIMKSLVSFNMAQAVIKTIIGANGEMYAKNYGRNFIPEKSWIRLNHPGKGKLGGGYRVKSIVMHDMWDSMTDNDGSVVYDDNFKYGQEYSYTLEDGETSSGVATYEPMGNKENPLIQPVFFTEDHKLAPDDEHYFETPFGESFFPSPSVGYGRITVRNLQRGVDSGVMDGIIQENELTVKRHATGYVEHKFFTSRDYPVITHETSIVAKPKKTNPFGNLLKLSIRDFMTISQGYSIELNDMNGKPRSQRVYAEGKEEYISGVDYVYDVNAVNTMASPTDDPFETFEGVSYANLNNDVLVISPEGSISTRQVGVSFDIINDFRESQTVTHNAGGSYNTATFLVGLLFGVVPTVFPSYSYQKTRFRSAGTTKVINRKGILREVIAHDAGASVSTRNLAWDEQTGEVLLTQTTNEYGDEVFNFNYPAHWAYSGMEQAYQNLDVVANLELKTGTSIGEVEIVLPSDISEEIFEGGDELAIYQATILPGGIILADQSIAAQKYWVKITDAGELTLIDKDGLPYTNSTPFFAKILRSGHRNQQAISIGSITSLTNPLIDESTGLQRDDIYFGGDLDAGILAANATEYSEDWDLMCECDVNPDSDVYNEYVHNTLGAWRPKRSSLYLGKRHLVDPSAPQVRIDGIYKTFIPFWNWSPSDSRWNEHFTDYPTPSDWRWTWASEVTNYSPFGFELENLDALGRSSAAMFNYNNKLPVAVSINAQYKEIGFDGFEEYQFDACTDDHFSFEKSDSDSPQATSEGTAVTGVTTTDETSHTGRYSIKVAGGGNIKATMTKKIIECQQP